MNASQPPQSPSQSETQRLRDENARLRALVRRLKHRERRETEAHVSWSDALHVSGLALVSLDGACRVLNFTAGASKLLGLRPKHVGGVLDELGLGLRGTSCARAVRRSLASDDVIDAILECEEGEGMLIRSFPGQERTKGRPAALLMVSFISPSPLGHALLAARGQAFRELAEQMNEVVVVCDRQTGTFHYANQQFEDTWGVKRESLYEDAAQFYDRITELDRGTVLRAFQRAFDAMPTTVEVELRDHTGARWMSIRTFPIENESGDVSQVGALAVDITRERGARRELMKRADALRRESRHDALTGKLNRRGLEQELSSLADGLSRIRGARASAILLDCDYFKRVNDSMGHDAGDALLRHIADVLEQSVRGQDIVGRIGGDEFLVITPGIGLEEAQAAANRVRRAVRSSVLDYRGEELTCTVSAGVASFDPSELHELDTVLRRTDRALSHAKREGKDRVGVEDNGGG